MCILHYITFHYITLYYIILYHIILYYNILYYRPIYGDILWNTIVYIDIRWDKTGEQKDSVLGRKNRSTQSGKPRNAQIKLSGGLPHAFGGRVPNCGNTLGLEALGITWSYLFNSFLMSRYTHCVKMLDDDDTYSFRICFDITSLAVNSLHVWNAVIWSQATTSLNWSERLEQREQFCKTTKCTLSRAGTYCMNTNTQRLIQHIQCKINSIDLDRVVTYAVVDRQTHAAMQV